MLYAQVLQADGASFRNILLAHQEGTRLPDPPPLLVSIPAGLQGLKSSASPRTAAASSFTDASSQPPLRALPANVKHSVNREPRAFTTFSQKSIETFLGSLSLPLNSPVSVLAVELLPGPFHINNLRGNQNAQAVPPVSAQPTATASAFAEDPLGTQLGLRRILRTSPLTQVPAIC